MSSEKQKGGEDTGRAKMKVNPGSPPGIELDGKGNVIPIEQRTKEDQKAARAAGEDDRSVKNPEHEAENPAPMPREGRKPA